MAGAFFLRLRVGDRLHDFDRSLHSLFSFFVRTALRPHRSRIEIETGIHVGQRVSSNPLALVGVLFAVAR